MMVLVGASFGLIALGDGDEPAAFAGAERLIAVEYHVGVEDDEAKKLRAEEGPSAWERF